MRYFRSAFARAVATLVVVCGATAVAKASGAERTPATLEGSISSGDLASAARIARERADMGDAEAQHALALFYWHGVVLTQNFQEAIRWSTLSALSGHKKAFAARQEMRKKLDASLTQKGMEWARARLIKLAEAGDNDALRQLADSYSARFGFENETEAYFWATLALSSGQAQVRRQRDALAASLKQGDVIKVQQKAADWSERWRKPRPPAQTGDSGEH